MKPSHARILNTLSHFRFVPTRILENETFAHCTPRSRQELTRRALADLRADGLVASQLVVGRTPVHYLTAAGAAALDIEGGHGGVRLAEYDHDLAVLHLYLHLRDDPRVDVILTERDIRSTGPDPADNPWAIPITRASGHRGWAWPDLATTGTAGTWGHEVEWSPKNRQRLRRLMIAYGRASHYHGGIYYHTPATSRLITTVANDANTRLADAGLGAQIITRPLKGHP